MQEKLLDDTLTAYQKALELTINRFNGGIASKADVAQAKTQVDTTRAERTDLEVARAQLEHAIAMLIGQPPANLAIGTGSIKNPPPPIPVGLPSQLLERRPDIAANERRVAAMNAEIGLAEVAYYPTLNLSASGGFLKAPPSPPCYAGPVACGPWGHRSRRPSSISGAAKPRCSR